MALLLSRSLINSLATRAVSGQHVHVCKALARSADSHLRGRMSLRSMKRVWQRVQELTGSNRGEVKDVRVLTRDINPVLHGWVTPYGSTNAPAFDS